MTCLIDTNIILRLNNPSHSQHQIARAAITALLSNNVQVCVAPQNLYEFWVVATRPLDRNGFGLSPKAALEELTKIEQQFVVLADSINVYYRWRELVELHGVSGLPSHDARLVALMLTHDVEDILTFNAEHFRRFPMIKIHVP